MEELLLKHGDIGIIVFLLAIAVWLMFKKIDKNKEDSDEKREKIEDDLASLKLELAVNKAKDETTALAVASIVAQFDKFTDAINSRLDKIDDDIKAIATEVAVQKGKNLK